jgi:hypothetical protein
MSATTRTAFASSLIATADGLGRASGRNVDPVRRLDLSYRSFALTRGIRPEASLVPAGADQSSHESLVEERLP